MSDQISTNDIVEFVAEKTELNKTKAKAAVTSTLEAIANGLKEGKRVSLVGFGSFSVTRREARTGRNPSTGAAINIPAKNVVRFKTGKALTGSVN